ncbi:hypothetical protein ACFVW2_22770 [Streptomyces sp. NPDC058171]
MARTSFAIEVTLEGAELVLQVSRSGVSLEIVGRHLARLISGFR